MREWKKPEIEIMGLESTQANVGGSGEDGVIYELAYGQKGYGTSTGCIVVCPDGPCE